MIVLFRVNHFYLQNFRWNVEPIVEHYTTCAKLLSLSSLKGMAYILRTMCTDKRKLLSSKIFGPTSNFKYE